jgi:hypothetical protein
MSPRPQDTAVLNRPDLRRARKLFEMACAASRRHSKLAAYALRKYGDHGPQVSGCVRDHFPGHWVFTLRELALSVTRFSDAAYAARPERVRFQTMRKLATAVATKYGSGFYGPQAILYRALGERS